MAVAACLYECDCGAWREFEPERKRLDESLSYLEYEGLVSFEDTVNRALQTRFTEIEGSGARWAAASRVAERALGPEKLRELIKRAEGEHTNACWRRCESIPRRC